MKGLRFCLLLLIAGCVSGGHSEGKTASQQNQHSAGGSTGPIHPLHIQLVTIVSGDWNTFRATLQRYERSPGQTWRAVGGPVEVVLGHAGYGWGRGLHGTSAPDGRGGPTKREGDGRSPAGVFEFGTAYGYEVVPKGVSLPYVQATPALRCVDDTASRHYNRIVSTSNDIRDWNSAEHMLRDDGNYEIAIVVGHNTRKPKPGAGSCIFLHVWAGPDIAVRGCTAMSKPELETLIDWLEPKAAVLVALPRSEYQALERAWNLP